MEILKIPLIRSDKRIEDFEALCICLNLFHCHQRHSSVLGSTPDNGVVSVLMKSAVDIEVDGLIME